jgi:hypothetical protein
MNILAFQGLLSWVQANFAGAQNGATWRHALGPGGDGAPPPSSPVPFPVTILCTEQPDRALTEPAVGPPSFEHDITLEPSALGLRATSTSAGFLIQPLGPPHPLVVHMRLLVQAQQRLVRSAWARALPDCVSAVPAEGPADLQRMVSEATGAVRGKIKTEGVYWWPGVLADLGRLTVTVKDATLPPSGGLPLPSKASSAQKAAASAAPPPQPPSSSSSLWPPLVDYTSGDPADPLAAVADVISYGPPQPYRPPMHRVVGEILTTVELAATAGRRGW